MRQIARYYGVSTHVIVDILRRKTWRHVPEEMAS